MSTRSHPPQTETHPDTNGTEPPYPSASASEPLSDLAVVDPGASDPASPDSMPTSPEDLAALVEQTRPRKDDDLGLRPAPSRRPRTSRARAALGPDLETPLPAPSVSAPSASGSPTDADLDPALPAKAALKRAQSISARVAATPRSTARRETPAPSAPTPPDLPHPILPPIEPVSAMVADQGTEPPLTPVVPVLDRTDPSPEALAMTVPDLAPPSLAPTPSAPSPSAPQSLRGATTALTLSAAPSAKAPLLWAGAGLAALAWPAGLGAYLLGSEAATAGLLATLPLKLTVYGLVGLLPAGLILAIAAVLRQSQRLAEENQRAHALAESMIAPASLAAQESHQLVHQIHAEITSAIRAADQARHELSALREAIRLETDRLHDTTLSARNASTALVRSLQTEREAMHGLSQELDQKSVQVLDAIERQARLVADAAALASDQLKDSEDSLSARTADLAAAAAETAEATRLAGEDLTRQSVRLESAGESVSNQVRALEQTLSSQRAALVAASHSLRKEQQDFADTANARQGQLVESLAHARLAATELSDASANGAEVLRDLLQNALEQVGELMSMGEREREEIAARAEESLTHFSDVVARTREALTEETSRAVRELAAASDDARHAADIAAAAAQARADQLAEAIFSAGKHADDSFNTRLREAERLVQEANGLVETAGSRAVEKLEVTRAQIRLTIEEMEGRLGAVPQIIREQMLSLTQHVEDSLNALVAKASNLPSRAGMSGGLAPTPSTTTPSAPNLAPSAQAGRVGRDRQNPGARLSERDFERERDRQVHDHPTDRAPNRPNDRPSDRPIDRTRPVARDEAPNTGRDLPKDRLARPVEAQPKTEAYDPQEVRALFAAARAGPDDEDDRDLSWDDLLSDPLPTAHAASAQPTRPQPVPAAPSTTSGAAHQPKGLEAMLLNELDRLGIDPSGLLPRTRVEDAARAIAQGDDDGARQLIRRVAPAAVRRLSRAVLSDAELRDPADRYVKLFESLLTDALRKPDPAQALMHVLPTEGGRLFLLLDAAIGDLG